MTITQQIPALRAHPYWKLAMTDEAVMGSLLFELMFHVYVVASANACKGYRAASAAGMNRPQVIEAIRDAAPPENLDLRLPIPVPCPVPEPSVVCVVTELPRTVKKARTSGGLPSIEFVGVKNPASIAVAGHGSRAESAYAQPVTTVAVAVSPKTVPVNRWFPLA